MYDDGKLKQCLTKLNENEIDDVQPFIDKYNDIKEGKSVDFL